MMVLENFNTQILREDYINEISRKIFIVKKTNDNRMKSCNFTAVRLTTIISIRLKLD